MAWAGMCFKEGLTGKVLWKLDSEDGCCLKRRCNAGTGEEAVVSPPKGLDQMEGGLTAPPSQTAQNVMKLSLNPIRMSMTIQQPSPASKKSVMADHTTKRQSANPPQPTDRLKETA